MCPTIIIAQMKLHSLTLDPLLKPPLKTADIVEPTALACILSVRDAPQPKLPFTLSFFFYLHNCQIIGYFCVRDSTSCPLTPPALWPLSLPFDPSLCPLTPYPVPLTLPLPSSLSPAFWSLSLLSDLFPCSLTSIPTSGLLLLLCYPSFWNAFLVSNRTCVVAEVHPCCGYVHCAVALSNSPSNFICPL